MRLARMFLAVAVSALPFSAFTPTVATAQSNTPATAEAPLPCSGKVNIVRVSEIKPGMMEKFMQAVAAQKAWYTKHGGDDEILVMRVMEQDPSIKAWKLSDTKAVTTHVMSAERKSMPHDAEWDAFVATFSQSSTIQNSYLTCMESTARM